VSKDRRRDALTPSERYFEYRLRYLPAQLDAARAKVAALEVEARRYGMTELLEAAQ
jgi:hypothetical protein